MQLPNLNPPPARKRAAFALIWRTNNVLLTWRAPPKGADDVGGGTAASPTRPTDRLAWFGVLLVQKPGRDRLFDVRSINGVGSGDLVSFYSEELILNLRQMSLLGAVNRAGQMDISQAATTIVANESVERY